jgi:hypothetical protein
VSIAALVIAVVASGPATTSAAPITGERIDQKMERALDAAYQRDLPGWDSSPGEPDGSDGGRLTGGGRGRDGGSGTLGSGAGSGGSRVDNDGIPRSRNGVPGDPRRRVRDRSSGEGDSAAGAFGGVATVLLWGLVIVAVILLLVFLVRQASGMTGEDEPVKTAADDAEDPGRLAAVIERPRDDADQLAHEGRFAEAMHTLLLRTLHELASQNLVRVMPAMTSREVLARVPLLGDARTALAGLVTAVEVTWFGDDVPGAGDYARCRQQFEVFAAAYRRGAAAGGRA